MAILPANSLQVGSDSAIRLGQPVLVLLSALASLWPGLYLFEFKKLRENLNEAHMLKMCHKVDTTPGYIWRLRRQLYCTSHPGLNIHSGQNLWSKTSTQKCNGLSLLHPGKQGMQPSTDACTCSGTCTKESSKSVAKKNSEHDVTK